MTSLHDLMPEHADRLSQVMEFRAVGVNKDKTFEQIFDKVKLTEAQTKLTEALGKVSGKDGESLDILKDNVTTAQAAFDHVAVDGRAPEGEEGAKVFNAAKTALDKARSHIDRFLRGEEVKVATVDADGTAAMASHKLEAGEGTKALTSAYKDFTATLDKATGILNSNASLVRTGGFVAALEHNGKRMQFWKEGMKLTDRGLAFAHGGAAVGSAVLLSDALLRSKTADGEDRSKALRVIEAVGAGALGTVALLGGKVPLAAR